MIVLGMISGTSADGIDVAIVDINGPPPDTRVEMLSFSCVPFNERQRSGIFELFDPATSRVDCICEMNFAIGNWFAQAALDAILAGGWASADIDLIASHGQTIYHSVEPGARIKSTLQIGESAVIVERTGITTVADVRVADVAAGGQGAPIVSYLDWLLLRDTLKNRASQNIGGIGNVTFLPPEDDPAGTLAFDTGPGNTLIDYAAGLSTGGAWTFDKDGEIGARGRIDVVLLAELMSHPYLRQPLPKTTGREQFGVEYAAQMWQAGKARNVSDEDIVATFTAYTAETIVDAYRRYLPQWPDEVIVAGGGVNNPTLMAMLAERLSPTAIIPIDDLGLDGDGKEAVAVAVLAYEMLHGRPNNIPSCTGAGHAVILGKMTPGSNYLSLLANIGT